MAKKSTPPRPTGRPTKCTPETQAVILDALRRGNFAVVAARLANIDEQTYYNWVKAADEGREPYAAFLGLVKKAEAEAEDASVQVVRVGASGSESVNWQAHAWYLERKYPARYGKRDPQRAEIAEIEKRYKQLEVEIAQAKLEALRAQGSTGNVEPASDDELDQMMRERFGGVRMYPLDPGESQEH